MSTNAKLAIAGIPGLFLPVCAGGDDGPAPRRPGGDTVVAPKPRTRTKKPSMYKVLLLNDDYTPMDFVIAVLERYFNKGAEDATRIMLHVHQNGVGICGVYTFEVAETKVTQVMDFARQHQHPLQCTMEKD
ncbi:ATP-dependent Clp protease adaptor protein ClpS [hydrothermal vent metagenome]|uniref:ATP-dependent Clp protease adaptor protein ClpS n=1 Tax=hydrothermal vent metagenome TaxID=652676 RepID=A0A3B0TNQ9_9ZZZZ